MFTLKMMTMPTFTAMAKFSSTVYLAFGCIVKSTLIQVFPQDDCNASKPQYNHAARTAEFTDMETVHTLRQSLTNASLPHRTPFYLPSLSLGKGKCVISIDRETKFTLFIVSRYE